MSQNGTWTPLRRAPGGGGVIDGPSSDLTTFRGEAFGLLATLQYVKDGKWTGRVQHRLDNEAVVMKFNKDQRLITAYQGCVHADSDVWAALYLLKEELGARIQVVWQRSHPEKRLAKAMWTRHDTGNNWSDLLADEAQATFTPGRQRLQLVSGQHCGWGVKWGGELVVAHVRETVLGALKAHKLRAHLLKNREWDAAVVAQVSDMRWAGRLKSISQTAAATLVNKMLFGWMATQTVLAKRGELEAGHSTKCRLGCDREETNWHVCAECTHPKVVAARRKCVESVHATVADMPVPEDVKGLLRIPWALDHAGRVQDKDTEDEVVGLVEDWAPGLAAAALVIREQLGWDRTHGVNHDAMWKWSFRGLMLDSWLVLMQELGVEEQEAQATLMSVEKQVGRSLPEVWRVFSTEVHEQRRSQATRRASTSRQWRCLQTCRREVRSPPDPQARYKT